MQQRIDPVEVHVRREEVAFFAAALGCPDSAAEPKVPWTYPAHWLAHPTVRQALVSLLNEDELPVHEAQQFIYAGDRLTVETSLVMRGEARRDASGQAVRIVINLRFEKDNVQVAELTCRLVVVRGRAGGHHDADSRP
jgi:hypothetical protein